MKVKENGTRINWGIRCFPLDLKQRVEIQAAKDHCTMREIVERALSQYLALREKGAPK